MLGAAAEFGGAGGVGRELGGQAAGFITRLHVRYDRAHLPEDLQCQETPDQEQYQARYVINHPLTAAAIAACQPTAGYARSLPARFAAEQANVVSADRLGRCRRREGYGRGATRATSR